MRIKDLQELAKVIELAQDIREESFVEHTGGPGEFYGYHTCDMYSAALNAAAQITSLPHEHVLVEGIAQLVYLLNTGFWNDIQAWNADILKLTEEV